MSFGKDRSQLAGIVGFGGTAAQKAANAVRKRQPQTGGRSKKPYWAGTYKPSELRADTCRLVAGEYKTQRVDSMGNVYEEVTPWVEYKEHYHGGLKKSGICSSGVFFSDRNRREPCHGCDLFWSESDRDKRVISVIDKFAMTIIDEGTFHRVPQVDDKGQYKMDPKTNQPYTTWTKCQGMGCSGCLAKAETKDGHIQPWAMSREQFNTLRGYEETIGRGCVTCGGRDVIQTVHWQCANTQCGELIIDPQTTTANLEQVMEVVNAPYTCQSCGVVAYPEEVLQCGTCINVPGAIPQRATIFDVDMQLKGQRTGEKKVIIQVLATSDPKPLDPKFEEQLKYKADLAKRFAPTPLAMQAEMWGLRQPQHVQNYTRP
jgi:hypothetical protein